MKLLKKILAAVLMICAVVLTLKIDKLAGPYLALGGQIEAKADGRVLFEIPKKSEWPAVDFKAIIDMWAGAEFGAEIKK